MIILLILFVIFCLFMAFNSVNLNRKAKNKAENQDAEHTTISNVKNSSNSSQQVGDKKFMLIFIIVLYVVLIGVIVIGALQDWGFLPTFIVAIVGILIGFLIFNFIKKSACPNCGKKFSMREISRKITDSYDTTMDVERQVKNNKGEVIRTYYEAVPATTYYYDCVDECKFCGYRRDVKRTATYRK